VVVSNRSKNKRPFVPNYARRQRVQGELPPPAPSPLATVTDLPTRRFVRRQALRGAGGVALLAGLGAYEHHRRNTLRKGMTMQLVNPFEKRFVSAESRRKLARSGKALGDGSFPMATREDVRNAEHDLGRTSPAKRRRAEALIDRRERQLGMSKGLVRKGMPVTGVTRLEARTPDGRYVSHANDATEVHIRPRRYPGSKALVVTRRGGRSGTRGSEVGKALGAGGVPLTARALLRAGQAGSRAGRAVAQSRVGRAAEQARSGFAIHRDELAELNLRTGREQRAMNGFPGVAGATASMATPLAGMGGTSAYLYGRHRGKAKAQSQLAKRDYNGDPYGRSTADVTVLANRSGTNSNIPDAARRGRRFAR